MHAFINSSWHIGTLSLPNRLIQGPLAGYSCAPFRELFYHFAAPAFCMSEMSSAIDIINKHSTHSRYLYRAPIESILGYQISGNDQHIMAEAALLLQNQGANLIDINCGCPKTKIRKKGAGSALLDEPNILVSIIKNVREVITIPLTVKIRIQGTNTDLLLAQKIENAGADALIVHGRRWMDDYDVRCDLEQIARIKKSINIPVIANGDISTPESLQRAMAISGCDAFMLSRAGSGQPWIYQELLEQRPIQISFAEKITLFMTHLHGLALLEDEFKSVLQSKSLVRYYFKNQLEPKQLHDFYKLDSLSTINDFLLQL